MQIPNAFALSLLLPFLVGPTQVYTQAFVLFPASRTDPERLFHLYKYNNVRT